MKRTKPLAPATAGTIKILAGQDIRVKVVDIGASSGDGTVPPYARVLKAGDADLVGFEPHGPSLAELNKNKGPHEIYLPHAVGDGQRHRIHFCFGSGMSSLLTPNMPVLKLFHLFPAWAQILGSEEIDTVSLDDIPETAGADFLKLDIQGAELMALSSAPKRLRDATVIQLEVNFMPMYVGQPLFSELEMFLRHNGFMVHCFIETESRFLRPFVIDDDPYGGLSQVLWADAIFVRDFTRLDLYTEPQLLKTATILHDFYGSLDAVGYLLNEYDRRKGTQVAARYIVAMKTYFPDRKVHQQRYKLSDAPHPDLS